MDIAREAIESVATCWAAVSAEGVGDAAISKLFLRIAGFLLMANACHKHQILGFVKLVASQIATASAGNNEFSQASADRAADAGLMRRFHYGLGIETDVGMQDRWF